MSQNESTKFSLWDWSLEITLYGLLAVMCVYLGSTNSARQYGIWFLITFVVISVGLYLLYPNRALTTNIMGVFGMLVIPSAILTGIGVLHCMGNITISVSPWAIVLGICCYLFYCVYVTRGMFYKEQKQPDINHLTVAPMNSETQQMLTAIEELEDLATRLKKEGSPVEQFDINDLLCVLNTITADYLWSCAEHYSIKSPCYNEALYDHILSTIPSSSFIQERSKSALMIMWNGIYALQNEGMEIDKYQKVSDIMQLIRSEIANKTVALYGSHELWMNQFR